MDINTLSCHIVFYNMLEICVRFLKIFVDKVTNARLRVYNNRTRL